MNLFRYLRFFVALFIFMVSHSYATDSYTATLLKNKYPTYPAINYGSGSQAEVLKRGEYLVKLGDCIACHTAHDGGKPFAGGLPIETPFGTLYTPNITPDKKTGIGNWDKDQFIKAMRQGISPQGKYYYPAFPYYYFNKVSTDDLLAIKAYLDTIPAVEQQNKANQMKFPFNWRFLQLGWRLLFFHPTGAYQPNSSQSADWNRGAYLVKGLGHCAMCHTPMYYFLSQKWVLGAPIQKYDLSGAFVQGFFAPNITRANLKNLPYQDLADVFLHDRLIGGGEVQGPMAEANHDSLKFLSMKDIKAIDSYLRTVRSQTQPQPKMGDGKAAGEKVYTAYCAGCHATGAGGAPKIGDAADWNNRLKQGINALYKNAINGIGGMPAKGTCTSCTTADIQNAVQYMIAQSHSGAAKVLGQTGEGVKALTLADGQQIYQRYCQACHNGSYQGAPVLGDKATWGPLINGGVENLILNSINGYNNMPARGSCKNCSDAEIKAAVIYMVEQGKTSGDYTLWLSS